MGPLQSGNLEPCNKRSHWASRGLRAVFCQWSVNYHKQSGGLRLIVNLKALNKYLC